MNNSYTKDKIKTNKENVGVERRRRMKLTYEGIKNREGWETAGITLPGYDVEAVAEATKKAPRWVHFGIGNIFRVFLGGIADTLLEKDLTGK